MGAITTVNLLLSVTNELLKHMPDYSQRKREEYYALQMEYKNELQKEIEFRDDNLIDELRDKLFIFIKSFSAEFSSAQVSPL